jgi:Domain of unknown function (DUF5667)
MARKLDDIFNECYERIRSGESLESCLRSYPQYRAQLDPLLRTTFDIGRRSSYIHPRPEFRHWSRVRLETAQRYPRQSQQAPAETPMASGWLRHGWAVVVTAGIILLLGTGSTMAASSNALPDQPLYPVKLASEQVQLAFAVSPARKAEVQTDLVNKRADELEAMANQGKTEEAAKAAERYDDQYQKALEAIMSTEEMQPQPAGYVPPVVTIPPTTTPSTTTPPTTTPSTTTPPTTTPSTTTPPTTTPPTTTPSTTTPPSTVTAASENTTPTATEQPSTTTGQTSTTGQPSTTTQQPTTTSKDDTKAARIEKLKKALDRSTTKSIAALTDAKDKASQDTKPDWQKAIDTVKKSSSRSSSGSGTTSVSDNQTGKTTTTNSQTPKKTYPTNHGSTHR